uniref:Transthyretin-like family protein n=1 Tax=Panagrolaimus sp. ES5 TaxID=591445 RepID=A0AC34FBH8_9BILA
MRFIFGILLFIALIAAIFANEQTVKVKGQVICNKIPVRNVLVQLRETDTFDPDDTLAYQRTDKDGNFRLTGTENEFTPIRPYLRKCHRLTDIPIPKKFINNDEYVLDPLNLNGYEYTEICN